MPNPEVHDCPFLRDMICSMLMGAPLALLAVPEEAKEAMLDTLAKDTVRLATKIHTLVVEEPDAAD